LGDRRGEERRGRGSSEVRWAEKWKVDRWLGKGKGMHHTEAALGMYMCKYMVGSVSAGVGEGRIYIVN